MAKKRKLLTPTLTAFRRLEAENKKLKLALADIELHAGSNLVQGIARRVLQEKPDD